jgi:hypothetical protein
MNTPVSYPIAKLLEEKGFEVKVRPIYYFDKSIHTGSYMYNTNGVLELCTMPEVGLKNGWIDSPTIADVVMWLYEKHGIWIYTYLLGIVSSCYVIQKIQKTNPKEPMVQLIKDSITYDELFNSPTEAYEAAFEYALNKLI